MDQPLDDIKIAQPLPEDLAKFYNILEQKGPAEVASELKHRCYKGHQIKLVKEWLLQKKIEDHQHNDRVEEHELITYSELTALFWFVAIISFFIFNHFFHFISL